jgi:hypothetical protein
LPASRAEAETIVEMDILASTASNFVTYDALHIVPVLLGDGARLFDNLGGAEIELEQVRAVDAPGVTHLKDRAMT